MRQEDILIFLEIENKIVDVFMSWDANEEGFVSGNFYDSRMIISFIKWGEDGLYQKIMTYDSEGYAIFVWTMVFWDKIGRVKINKTENAVGATLVCGDRQDLMTVFHFYSELREDGDNKEVIRACCEMTGL